jgi:hypothetical protein
MHPNQLFIETGKMPLLPFANMAILNDMRYKDDAEINCCIILKLGKTVISFPVAQPSFM